MRGRPSSSPSPPNDHSHDDRAPALLRRGRAHQRRPGVVAAAEAPGFHQPHQLLPPRGTRKTQDLRPSPPRRQPGGCHHAGGRTPCLASLCMYRVWRVGASDHVLDPFASKGRRTPSLCTYVQIQHATMHARRSARAMQTKTPARPQGGRIRSPPFFFALVRFRRRRLRTNTRPPGHPSHARHARTEQPRALFRMPYDVGTSKKRATTPPIPRSASDVT